MWQQHADWLWKGSWLEIYLSTMHVFPYSLRQHKLIIKKVF